MATFPVKWFSGEMQTAPALSGRYETGWTSSAPYLNMVPGEITTALKAFLIDGFGETAATDITYDSGTDRVTVTFATAHEFKKYSVIEVSGADQAQYNGEFRVTAVTPTTLQYQPDSAPAATPATTGTAFSVKLPPVDGWELIDDDNATNQRIVLGRTAADATPYKILVRNDQNYGYVDFGSSVASQAASYAKIEVIDNFVDYDTYDTVLTHYIPSWSNGYGSTSTNQTNVGYFGNREPYYFYADAYCWYWHIPYTYYGQLTGPYFCGDIESVRPGDRGHFMCNGVYAEGPNMDTTSWSGAGRLFTGGSTQYESANRAGAQVATNFGNVPGSVRASTVVPFSWQKYPSLLLRYPNPANSGLYISKERTLVCTNEFGSNLYQSNATLRGFMPGFVSTPQYGGALHEQVIEGVPGFGTTPIHCTRLYGYIHTEYFMSMIRLDQWRDLPQ